MKDFSSECADLPLLSRGIDVLRNFIRKPPDIMGIVLGIGFNSSVIGNDPQSQHGPLIDHWLKQYLPMLGLELEPPAYQAGGSIPPAQYQAGGIELFFLRRTS